MPWYRVNGLPVHLNLGGRRAPAPCAAPIELEGKHVRCCAISTKLCDWETGPGQTCSAPICDEHATSIGKDMDLCPAHAPRRAERPGQDGLF